MKVTVKRMKRQATGWEKIFSNHLSIKEFTPMMYKKLSKLKIKSSTQKWAKDLNRHFTKEDIMRANSMRKDVPHQ